MAADLPQFHPWRSPCDFYPVHSGVFLVLILITTGRALGQDVLNNVPPLGASPDASSTSALQPGVASHPGISSEGSSEASPSTTDSRSLDQGFSAEIAITQFTMERGRDTTAEMARLGIAGSGLTQQGRIFIAPNKWRTEVTQTSHPPGRPSETVRSTKILRFDTGLMWAIDPEKRSYWEAVFNPAEYPSLPGLHSGWRSSTPTDRNDLDGQSADRYVHKTPIQVQEMYLTPGSFLPLKVTTILQAGTSGDGSRDEMTFSNVQPGPQPAALFELPPGFSKTPAPSWVATSTTSSP